MTTRYSDCHFAEVMDHWFVEKTMPPVKRYTPKCSYCGEFCEPVPMAHTLQPDLELTLRRWKDGDCSLDDMFERVNTELQRSWQAAFGPASEALQGDGRPKFVYRIDSNDWVESDA